jgi:hypothetical protein
MHMRRFPPIKATNNRRVMNEVFLFNSPPRSGNVFLTFLFSMFIGQPVTKCLEIEKYSDKAQRQAVFFRDPYDSIPSTIVKSRIDSYLGFDEEDLKDISYSISNYAKEYLGAIKEAKANQSNLYLGRSEDMMNDPIGTITDIALFFDFELQNQQISNNNQIVEEIKQRMFDTEKTRVDRFGETVKENLMTDHDGHLPRTKIESRIVLDKMIRDLDLDIVRECYNEYISIKPTNAKEGQRWES